MSSANYNLKFCNISKSLYIKLTRDVRTIFARLFIHKYL